MDLVTANLDGFTLVLSEKEFLQKYPAPEFGKYRPQSYPTPSKYPVLIKEEGILPQNRGPDDAILSIVPVELVACKTVSTGPDSSVDVRGFNDIPSLEMAG